MADNVRSGLKMYCGNKTPIPPRTYMGTPLACFRRGFGIGLYVQREKQRPARLQERQRTEAITSVLVRRKLAQDIETKGLNVLKRDIRIGDLPLGLLKGLAQRLTGTEMVIPRYGMMNREEIIEALVLRGFRR